ncbi:MAG: HNH endonuclease signature motif containing protein [Terriglobales bacterium]
MNSKLRKGERCPIHKGYFCCGREKPKPKHQAGPVIRVMDDTHPRGYREECSGWELRRRKNLLIARGEGCLYCDETFNDYRQIELAHRNSKGMGGSRHDDHISNLGLAHRFCNRKNGSKSQEVA